MWLIDKKKIEKILRKIILKLYNKCQKVVVKQTVQII